MKVKRIAVLTATRAEYGLLKRFISKLHNMEKYEVEILVTGAHLSIEHGYTYQEIIDDGFTVRKKVEILDGVNSAADVSKSMARAMVGFADYFSENKPDALVVLGDRYETMAVCICAMNSGVPIFHLHGGETTEGAIDEAIRHSITKMAYLHFTSTELYRRRVIQLGENPHRVFNVGALGVENAVKEEKYTLQELQESLKFDLSKPYGVVTYHPVTLENKAVYQIANLINAMNEMPEYQYIITGANADCGGEKINNMLQQYAQEHENAIFVHSLGMKRYLSAIKYCQFVLGNSSSGIIEAPSFGVPTINIGNRQKGRLRADSVIDCKEDSNSIVQAVKYGISRNNQTVNPYGDGNTSDKIISIIDKIMDNGQIDLAKKFYDVEY